MNKHQERQMDDADEPNAAGDKVIMNAE